MVLIMMVRMTMTMMTRISPEVTELRRSDDYDDHEHEHDDDKNFT